jgi:hypothetical protein
VTNTEIRHCAMRIKNLLALYRGRDLPPFALDEIERNAAQILAAASNRPIADSPNIVPFTRNGRG